MKQQQLQQDTLLLSNGNHGLEDIKQAIEQLTLRSSSSGGGSGATVMLNHHSNPFMAAASSGGVFSSAGPHHQAQALSTGHHGGGGSGGTNRGADTGHHSSYSTSTYSSMSGSECDRQHRRPHHLIRHSSLETINTQVQKYLMYSVYLLRSPRRKFIKCSLTVNAILHEIFFTVSDDQ